jgi:hypothetical protein
VTARLFVPGRQVSEREVGRTAAEVAIAKVRSNPSDPEVIARAASRCLADAGYGFASIPPEAFRAFCERIQFELQREVAEP